MWLNEKPYRTSFVGRKIHNMYSSIPVMKKLQRYSDNLSISKGANKSPSDTITDAIVGPSKARVAATAHPSNFSESL
jgi:hypothetical protein